jgi:hypothetical protein
LTSIGRGLKVGLLSNPPQQLDFERSGMNLARAISGRLAPVWALALLVALFAPGLTAAQVATAKVESGPDVAAVTFYKWYLGQLVQNKDPLHDAVTEMKRQVATPLLREIEKKINSADGMEADYFIAAQDYLDDWPTHVSATIRDRRDAVATVQVQLGVSTQKPYRLRVDLIKEKGDWKIRKVSRI